MGFAVGGDDRGQCPGEQDENGKDAGDEGELVPAVAVPGGVPEARAGASFRDGGAWSGAWTGAGTVVIVDSPSRRTRGSTST